MERIAAQERLIKHELALELAKAWVDILVDPELTYAGRPLVGDIALQTSLFVYGLITVGADTTATQYTDGENAAWCKRFGISWTRCTGIGDIYRCVQWAIKLQDKITHCQSRPKAA